MYKSNRLFDREKGQQRRDILNHREEVEGYHRNERSSTSKWEEREERRCTEQREINMTV